MYPALVNCTTIDWFSEWPQDALLEVADKYLAEMVMGNEEEVCYSKTDIFLFQKNFLSICNLQILVK